MRDKFGCMRDSNWKSRREINGVEGWQDDSLRTSLLAHKDMKLAWIVTILRCGWPHSRLPRIRYNMVENSNHNFQMRHNKVFLGVFAYLKRCAIWRHNKYCCMSDIRQYSILYLFFLIISIVSYYHNLRRRVSPLAIVLPSGGFPKQRNAPTAECGDGPPYLQQQYLCSYMASWRLIFHIWCICWKGR